MFQAFTTFAAETNIQRHTVFRPRNKMVTSDFGGLLSDEEKEILALTARRTGYDEMILLANLNTNFKTLFPPTGYVATCHQDTRFYSDAWAGSHTLFRGFAYCQVDVQSALYLSDDVRALFKKRLNLFMRDKSPSPPRVHAQGCTEAEIKGGWVASLGKAGWVGLYGGRRVPGTKSEPSSQPGKVYYMCVVAGLDETTYDDLDRDLHSHSGQGMTLQAMFGERGYLSIYRRLAAENRNRLLAIALELLELSPKDGTLLEYPNTFLYEKDPKQDQVKVAKCLAWMDMGPACRLPAWFQMPKTTPRGCTPIPADLREFPLGRHMRDIDPLLQKRPKYVDSVLDIAANDVLAYSEILMAIYHGCVTTLSPNGVPFTFGPAGDVIIYNAFQKADWTHAPMKNAFPHEALATFDVLIQRGDYLTWERQDLEVNRNVSSTWHYEEPMEDAVPDNRGGLDRGQRQVPIKLNRRYGDVCFSADRLELELMLGRVSAKDPSDLAKAMPEGERRFYGASFEPNYEFI